MRRTSSSLVSSPSIALTNLHAQLKLTQSTGGENISSVALESVLVTHPEILECAIVAVKDEQWGERPKAYITVKRNSKLDNQTMIKWCKDHRAISRFMVPREVEVIEELPKTSTGKVRKNVLRDWEKGGKRELGP